LSSRTAPVPRPGAWSGLVTGAIALAGVAVLHSDAHALYHQLVAGEPSRPSFVSILAGAGTLVLVSRADSRPHATAPHWRWRRSCGLGARPMADDPPGLSVSQARPSHDTLVAVVVSVLAGARSCSVARAAA